MADILRLSKERKQRERAKKRAKADENAVKFGRPKAWVAHEAAQADHAQHLHDGHRREEP